MADLTSGHDRTLDAHADIDAALEAARIERHTEGVRVDEGVERAAEREIVAHVPETLDADDLIQGDRERRNVLERDLAHPIAIAYRARRDASGRRVVADHIARALARLEERGRKGDDPVAAHRAPALVVHEQDAEVAIGRNGLGWDRAVHVRVAARLEHDRSA